MHQQVMQLVDSAGLDITALPVPSGRSLLPFASMEKYARLGQTLLRTAHQTISVARPSSESLQVPAVVDSSAILGQQVPDRQGSKTAPSAMKICREGLASKGTTALALTPP